jgi:hypothetical protein
MRRRDFLKTVLSGVVFSGLSSRLLADNGNMYPAIVPDASIRDYFHKMKSFDRPHRDDVCLSSDKLRILNASLARLNRLQQTIGYGNFHLLSFDEAIKFARKHDSVGRFTKTELDFLEWIFYQDAANYGFFGKKPMNNLTDRIQRQKILNIRGTGNYLYKGRAVALYEKLKKDVGNQLILTSGVRSVMKQTLLFLNRAHRCHGNMSLASRSLAPPGFSYHSVGDFDVGQVGYGAANFTERFIDTWVFKKIRRLDYVELRYPDDNLLGVRFEPWHIKVVSS